MEFEERVERFFKQFKTCLGIEPDLRVSYLHDAEVKLKDQEGTYNEIIKSPRLPFDLTEDERKAMGDQWAHIDLDHERTELMRIWEVDPKYKTDTEIIKIGLAKQNDGLKLGQAKAIIEEYMIEIWGDEVPPYAGGSISFCQSIYDDAIKWSSSQKFEDEKRKQFVKGDFGDYLFNRLVANLHQKRLFVYEKLIKTIEGKDFTKNYYLEDNTLFDKQFRNKYREVLPSDLKKNLYGINHSEIEWFKENFFSVTIYQESDDLLRYREIKEGRKELRTLIKNKDADKKASLDYVEDPLDLEQPSNYLPRTIKVKGKGEEFQNNFIDKRTFPEIYDHFSKYLVEKHLSKEDLNRYIWGAFHHQRKCNSFTFKNFGNNKGYIRDVWVDYYRKDSSSYGNKKFFIPLLGDYFKEFDTEKMLAELEENKSNFK